MNNRRYAQNGNNPPQAEADTTVGSFDSSNSDNNFQVGAKIDSKGNVTIAQDVLGYTTPMDAEEQIKLVSKYEDKKLEKDTALAGVASLQNAFGKTGGFSTVFGSYTPR